MMKSVYITAHNIVSSLGYTSSENACHIAKETSGIKLQNNIGNTSCYASIIADDKLNNAFKKIGTPTLFTKLEQMMLLSLNDTISKAEFSITPKTALIIATTKGNIDVLNTDSTFSNERAYLPELGKTIQTFFGFINTPIIVSNACVSGVLAITVAKRLIQNNYYDNAFVVGGDIVSEFTLAGFQSFQAISDEPCKPFSKNRKGINLGEAAASVAICKKNESIAFKIIGDASCNDANHISGPSRQGEGLYKSIQSACNEAQIKTSAIDFISAHGTATLYNDEMEAIAFNRAQLQSTPLNSLKGYYGHTLGASGLVETIIGLESLANNTLFTSLGMDELGVSKLLNIIDKTTTKTLTTFLKTASGFGGCNTAILIKKELI